MSERAIESAEQPQNKFEYISTEETKSMLESFGYGGKMMLVDAFYFNKETRSCIGVVVASKERCDGHNNIFRGVDMIEATAQTRLLLDKMIYDEKDKAPLFKGVNFEFLVPAPVGSILNIHIDKNEDIKTDSGMISTGRIFLGENIISKGKIEGTVIDKTFFGKYLEREERKLSNRNPKFPIIY